MMITLQRLHYSPTYMKTSGSLSTPTYRRPLLLTAYLIVSLVSNILSTFLHLIAGDMVLYSLPTDARWITPALACMGLLNIVCIVGLFRWKKWGFWGMVLSSILVGMINFHIGLAPSKVAPGLAGSLILYALLHRGQDRKAWPRLRWGKLMNLIYSKDSLKDPWRESHLLDMVQVMELARRIWWLKWQKLWKGWMQSLPLQRKIRRRCRLKDALGRSYKPLCL